MDSYTDLKKKTRFQDYQNTLFMLRICEKEERSHYMQWNFDQIHKYSNSLFRQTNWKPIAYITINQQ